MAQLSSSIAIIYTNIQRFARNYNKEKKLTYRLSH